MLESLKEIDSEFDSVLLKAESLADLNSVKSSYIGKSGKLKKLLFAAKQRDEKELLIGVNKLFKALSQKLHERQKCIEDLLLQRKLEEQKIDVTYPPRDLQFGSNHCLSESAGIAIDIFSSMGFSLVEGPEIESEYRVFDALNTPKHHPARQMQDTFFLENGKVLRTHTSSVQILTMQNGKPPFKIVSCGRVYRKDWDATHSPMFHQIEGLYIDKGVNMSHMRSCIEIFLKKFFGKAEIRLRPSYFPFTEPSAEVDIKDANSNWLEILGCGMVHPNVLKNVGVDSSEYTGFAFGVGLERITMLKNNITDLRNFFSCDFRWGAA